MLKSFLRRVAAALGLAGLLVAAPASAKAPAPAHPALWKVSDADTTIYLFGTIHLLPNQYQWRTPKFDEAAESSQQLIVETIVDPEHPQDFAAAFAQLGLSPTPLPPILDRVSPGKRAALEAALAKIHETPAQLDRVKTWAVGFQLLSLQFAQLGVEGQEGPEIILRKQFAAEHKSVDELETIRQQLGFFDTLSEKAQRDFLEGALESPEAATKEFGVMLSSWSRGDVPMIATVFNQDLSGSPELARALVAQRNASWSKWIEQRMAQPGTILVAVGAGHLAGKGSVIAMLQKDGYRVQRLQ
jgi:uncharacterized protein YbaP (TraB family)